MRLGSQAVRFSLGPYQVVGNVRSGTIVGLTPEGDALVEALSKRDVLESEVAASCVPLVDYLMTNGFMEDGQTTGEPDALPSRVRSAYLHVTHQCNLACVGCYSADANRNVADDPTERQICRAITLLRELGVERLVISGGEPFLRDDLGRIVRHAKALGIEQIVVLTNGTLCTEKRLEDLVGAVDEVSVSFDGASSSSPAAIRGSQRFGALVEAVGAIRSAGIHAHILPTIHAGNIEDVPAYIELARDLGATVGFSLLSGNPCVLGGLMPGDARLERLADVMIELVEHGVSYVAIDDVFNPGQPLLARDGCGAGKTTLSVAADGGVYPCHMLHAPEFKLGDAFADDLAALRRVLDAFELPRVDAVEGCKTCDKRYLCGGGCRARGYLMSGRITAQDPYCAYCRRAVDKSIRRFVGLGKY